MSSNGTPSSVPAPNSSSAVGVAFSSVAHQHGDAISQAESQGSSKRSNRSDKRREEVATPPDKSSLRDGGSYSGNSSVRQRIKKSGGFLLDRPFANGSPRSPSDQRGKRKVLEDDLGPDHRRPSQRHATPESFQRSTSPSRRDSMNASMAAQSDEHSVPPSQNMDPTQLVRMALDLSESRKRHVARPLSMPTSGGRRDASGLMSDIGTVRAPSSNQQRFSSSYDAPQSQSQVEPNQDQVDLATTADNVVYTFSPATLSRAEKARRYFEQASQYRRLLQHLPPLKTSSSNHFNNDDRMVEARKSTDPQRASGATGQVSKHELGRQYNPIQSLRNRRIRIRDKRPFPAPQESWHNVEGVQLWVDEVERLREDPDYVDSNDHVNLPRFSGEKEINDGPIQDTISKHRRNDTATSVITRPENSWTIEPSELLADAYWTEKDNNRMFLEDRRGSTIYQPIERHSVDTPKISIDAIRDKDENMENASETDDDDVGRRTRRRRLFLQMKGADQRRHKRLLARTSSVSSDSSFESPITKTKRTRRGSTDENLGPLERYMEERIAKEEKGDLPSPEVTSPDRWKSHHLRSSIDKPDRGSPNRVNGRASLEVPRDHHRRTRSADGRVHSKGDESPKVDGTNRDSWASTTTSGHQSTGGTDFAIQDEHKPKRSKLGLFRSDSKERNKIAQTDFATEANGSVLTPIPSAGSGHTRRSLDSGRTLAFRRHKTGDSITGSLGRFDTNTTSNGTASSPKEPSSTVGRFLKGGRIGGIVRSENIRLGDRFRNRNKSDIGIRSDVEPERLDASDTDEYLDSLEFRRRATDESDVSERASLDVPRTKPRYHLSNLPSFTSSARDKRSAVNTPGSVSNDPLNQVQEGDGAQNRSKRFNRLTLPRLKLPNSANASNPELAADTAKALESGGRKNYGLLRPDSHRASLAPMIPPNLSPGQRHWSISDQPKLVPQQITRVSRVDVARAQALLLSSGIKAREIHRRANNPRHPPNSFLVRAAATANQDLEDVPLKEDQLVAARLLSSAITSRLTSADETIMAFAQGTAPALATRLNDLHSRVADALTARVSEASDDADAFVVELTTRTPQQTKAVDDAIDAMLRLRRRQFRLLRRFGFKALEWMVLALMWGIWFLVMIVMAFKRVLYAAFSFVRWLIWF